MFHHFRTTRKLVSFLTYSCHRSYSCQTICEGEIVVLKSSVNDRADPILTRPLKPGAHVSYKSLKNIIKHDAIIGKQVREFVRAKNGVDYRIYRPTIGEFTDNSPRLVTPIYSQDANFIVSLLDLHPTVPGTDGGKLEIFEAGTGHGALTLYLARAIHAANTLPPEIPYDILLPNSSQSPARENYEEWRKQRRAVIHSLDNEEKHTRHAAANIKTYRNGIYFPHINFYTGCIESFFSGDIRPVAKFPFLDHAILDLPSPDKYMAIVSNALKEMGLLLVFVPSISQINKTLLLVRSEGLPLILDQVLEIGGMIGTGGREWDVRPVKPRALLRAEMAETSSVDSQSTIETLNVSTQQDSEFTSSNLQGCEMVCRPKVGLRITNGGFVGVWRKVHRQARDPSRGS